LIFVSTNHLVVWLCMVMGFLVYSAHSRLPSRPTMKRKSSHLEEYCEIQGGGQRNTATPPTLQWTRV
jgi:hypothetical protein